MSRKQREQRTAAASQKKAGSKLWRFLVPCLLALAGLALGVTLYWWFTRPKLEPYPVVAQEGLEPQVQALVQAAIAQVDAHPHSAQAWGDLGAVFRAHDLGAEAEPCFRNAERLDSADYRWPYLIGMSLAATDGEQALDCFRRAAQLGPGQPHVKLQLAEMLIERGEHGEAAKLVEQVIFIAPFNPRGQLAKARLLFAEEKLAEAKSWAEKSAAGARDRRGPHLFLAQLCRRTGDREGEARELAILAEIPDGITTWEDPDASAIRALRLDRAARLAAASSARDFLSEVPAARDSSVALLLARAYYREKNFPAAEAALRGELRRFPTDERLHFELGIACFQLQKFQDAAQAFSRVIEVKPDQADAHYNLGRAQLKLEDREAARESFAAAVRLQPSHAFARISLGELLLQAGEAAAAREHLEIAVRLAPQEQRALELLQKARRASRT